jgi:DNA-binding Xre family transcriptional regulator
LLAGHGGRGRVRVIGLSTAAETMTMLNNRGEGSSLKQTLANQTASECSKAGMSVAQLALASAIDVERLNSIMNGKARDITLREIAGLALGLGTSLSVLLGDL